MVARANVFVVVVSVVQILFCIPGWFSPSLGFREFFQDYEPQSEHEKALLTLEVFEINAFVGLYALCNLFIALRSRVKGALKASKVTSFLSFGAMVYVLNNRELFGVGKSVAWCTLVFDGAVVLIAHYFDAREPVLPPNDTADVHLIAKVFLAVEALFALASAIPLLVAPKHSTSMFFPDAQTGRTQLMLCLWCLGALSLGMAVQTVHAFRNPRKIFCVWLALLNACLGGIQIYTIRNADELGVDPTSVNAYLGFFVVLGVWSIVSFFLIPRVPNYAQMREEIPPNL